MIKSLEGFTSLSQCHRGQQGRGGMDYGVTLALLGFGASRLMVNSRR